MARWILYALLLIPGTLFAGKPSNPASPKKIFNKNQHNIYKYQLTCYCGKPFSSWICADLWFYVFRKHNCKSSRLKNLKLYFHSNVSKPLQFNIKCPMKDCTKYYRTYDLGCHAKNLQAHLKKSHGGWPLNKTKTYIEECVLKLESEEKEEESAFSGPLDPLFGELGGEILLNNQSVLS